MDTKKSALLSRECFYTNHVARFAAKLCLSLEISTFLVCLAMHIATFFATVPPIWVLVPFAMFGISVVVSRIIRDPVSAQLPFGAEKTGLLLFAYAIATCIYVYRATGGASSVAIHAGVYVSLYKEHVIKILTPEEYIRIPNLWTRALSAWFGAIAWFSSL